MSEINNDTKAVAEKTVEDNQELLNILLVDDRPENLISLESILTREGRKILKAESGEEALRIALDVDLAMILLDVQMPGMDGFEVARLLKANSRTRDIAIIFVTAISKEEKYTIQGYEEGAVDYLLKPLDVHVVRAKVDVFSRLYTQRKQLVEKNKSLEALNKQLDEFVYIVSHDLKAPLRGLSSLATFMEDAIGENPNDEVIELLDMMKSRTGRMQQLIDGILHYTKLTGNRIETEVVDVKGLIINVLDLIGVPDNIRVEIPDRMPTLECPKIKLHEVFQNLLFNAIKYNDKEQGNIKVACEEYENEYLFSVADNGVGIKPEHHEKIFGMFQTLQSKDKCESTGIGLTIVKKIVENQGGKVSLRSVPGQGSTFSFTWNK
ncbi:MAG: hybrid sensor histidine kinase/response regulator [Bacteroidetes bacterium]|nr:MAG: hybrid sensor histidine kinase/response regulator [Bacteroidota bacterium]REK00744.1 MAG: hybrid sensor histidine kinase/response regulator [Bacteroidota bacterium]REK34992.1 MAG: hybrid sensor histidine kinase/response regulator [Bacteroidota bacterium]REK48210.1 MAG: hybrid sensor histidine kinase/response regulator [Bacteroidota bacterium]